MSKKAKQWYYIADEQIAFIVAQGTYPGAQEAWDQARQIKQAGQKPTIYYSEFNGFRVINEDDPEQFKIGLSIRDRAKRFPT